MSDVQDGSGPPMGSSTGGSGCPWPRCRCGRSPGPWPWRYVPSHARRRSPGAVLRHDQGGRALDHKPGCSSGRI